MWNHICFSFENMSKRITVALNGKIISNEIDKHLQDVDALIPLKGLFIMGDYDAHQKKHTASLFGKMSDVQVKHYKLFLES